MGGMSGPEIERKYGCHNTTVYKILRNNHIPRRHQPSPLIKCPVCGKKIRISREIGKGALFGEPWHSFNGNLPRGAVFH